MTTNKNAGEIVKQQLIEFLTKASAHVTFEDAVKNMSIENAGAKPENLPYSIWQLVEHIRIAQWDILEFSRNPNHISPKWPDEYWPKEASVSDKTAWERSLQQIEKDKEAFIQLLNDPSSDLYTPFPHGDGQNLLREALLIADHTSYHTGEILAIRRLLNDWG